MALAWDKLERAAGIMQLVGIDAFGVISMIVQSAHTARRNKDECVQLAKQVEIVRGLLEKLDIPELKGQPQMRRALEQLDTALHDAYNLVRLCNEEENLFFKLFKSCSLASDLAKAQEKIDRYSNLIPTIVIIAAHTRGTRVETQAHFPPNPPELGYHQDASDLLALEGPPPTVTVAVRIEEVTNESESESESESPYHAVVLGRPTSTLSDLFEIGGELGQGYYLCTERATGIDYACKSISQTSFITMGQIIAVRRDIQVMFLLYDHSNVATIKGAYEDQFSVHIVLELCAGGSLSDLVRQWHGRTQPDLRHTLGSNPGSATQHGPCSEERAAKFTGIIVGVIEACHSLGIMHRAVCPENFLLSDMDADSSLKAINFGLSVFFEPGQVFTDIVYGNQSFVAPEVLYRKYGPPADVWAAGVILHILLCGTSPFYVEMTEQGNAVLKGVLDFNSDPWPMISADAKDLIRGMLNRRPAERLTAHEVLCHQWICQYRVTSDHPRDAFVLSGLKQYAAMTKLKKLVLLVIGDRSLFQEENAGFVEIFKIFDTDNSGTLTFAELKDGLRRYGSTLNDAEICDLMAAVDFEGRGTIDVCKFIAAMMHLNNPHPVEKYLQAAFSYFDKEESGYITVEDLETACKEYDMEDDFVADVVDEATHDYSGSIGYEDFVVMMTTSSTWENNEKRLEYQYA